MLLQPAIAAAAILLMGCGQDGDTTAAERLAAPVASAVAAAFAAVPAVGDAPTLDRTNRTGAAVLRPILLQVGQIDGQHITDFRLVDRCHTAFVAAGTTVTIDWSKVGNFAGRDEAGRTILDIDDGTGSHAISVPTGNHPEPLGDAAARVDSALSLIAGSCGG
ncbi:hypothetical protein [Sphingomonas endolithica]|uniref:hypothetical protein n=1 Tax=Sphingomonas endolithica TaxID=2972485 RepID=UPI0021AFE0DD|nr:hypothetical protein [Sphingomonas sp. ZFBP2030]